MGLLWMASASAKAAEAFDEPAASAVFSTALAFLAPRTLEPVSIPQLTVWGLRGLTALDPALTTELRETEIHLLQDGHSVFAAALPDAVKAAGWGALAASMAASASNVSGPVRTAGTPAVIRSFFDEMFNHLDPYSRYVPPAAADMDRGRRLGQAGLGMTLARRRVGMVVRDVQPSSPADDAGLRPGDRILSVDGRPVRGEAPGVVEGWINGPDGSTVQLSWRAAGRVQQAEIERALVPPQTVRAERLDDVVLIHVSGFSRDTDDQFAAALEAGFANHRVRGIVVDLRGNRGGLLRQAVAMVDQVLTQGIAVTTAGRNPDSSRVWPAGAGDDAAHGLPIVVMVDGRTASAAEIMAAGGAHNRRAVVVGSSTLGKGLVQTISPLPDGGELFVTWSRVLAPGGWPIQGLGVMPQVCTSLGEDALRVQLANLLRGQLEMAAALARHDAARAPLPAAQVVELRNDCPAAEGRDGDLTAAGFLLDHPGAYQTALLGKAGH